MFMFLNNIQYITIPIFIFENLKDNRDDPEGKHLLSPTLETSRILHQYVAILANKVLTLPISDLQLSGYKSFAVVRVP